MRVVHIQRAKGIGGSERHLLSLLPALRARGHEVVMIVLVVGGGERFVSRLRSRDVEVIALRMRAHGDPMLIGDLVRSLRRTRPDVCHTHLVHADVHGQLAATVLGIPAVSTLHGASQLFSREPTRTLAAASGRLAARKIAISHHLAEFAVRHRIAPEERIRVIPYGLDMTEWTLHPAAPEVDDVTFVVASRLIPGKGHDFLIRGFSEALKREPGLRLRIAGEGPLRDDLEQMVSSLDLSNRVEFLGFVDDVADLIRESDVVAFPTLPSCGEGFGLVALEAMALGRPVVGTTVGAIPEVVAHEETGLLVEPGDVDGLTTALLRVARDSKLRKHLGRKGRQRAEDRFGLDLMVDRTEEVYNEVLP